MQPKLAMQRSDAARSAVALQPRRRTGCGRAARRSRCAAGHANFTAHGDRAKLYHAVYRILVHYRVSYEVQARIEVSCCCGLCPLARRREETAKPLEWTLCLFRLDAPSYSGSTTNGA